MPERTSRTGVQHEDVRGYIRVRERPTTANTSRNEFTSRLIDLRTDGRSCPRRETPTTALHRSHDESTAHIRNDVLLALENQHTGQTLEAPTSMKKGGKVKKTGIYLLHKGEHVIPVKKEKKKK